MLARLLAFAVALSALTFAAPAEADLVQIGARVGATSFVSPSGRSVRPHLRVDASVRAAGPFLVGAYLDVNGEAFPLKTPHFGGGLQLVLRPKLPGLPIRPMLEASGGAMRVPTDVQDTPSSAFVATLAGGVAIDLSRRVSLEGRLAHSWLFGDAEATRAFNGSVGFILRLP